jgi:hypothetical protein
VINEAATKGELLIWIFAGAIWFCATIMRCTHNRQRIDGAYEMIRDLQRQIMELRQDLAGSGHGERG